MLITLDAREQEYIDLQVRLPDKTWMHHDSHSRSWLGDFSQNGSHKSLTVVLERLACLEDVLTRGVKIVQTDPMMVVDEPVSARYSWKMIACAWLFI